ncbi:hypothetical protein AMATHDRAFT_65546 [Amanita thiersii Skay4041]|uniref:Phosphoinositide phospholipase C n=1 Tax=Amanita thiersii Skay4041 TaxID=703135 RepID=A0A2A9NGI8_9AGAR|nr:hypothetical protein AMATHDRAFT_65546 [Amanita thiersii Skay4041]
MLQLDTSSSSSPSSGLLLRERSLRRAGNVLKSNGKPVIKELASPDPLDDPLLHPGSSGSSTSSSATGSRRKRGLSVSATIIRKIQEASKNLNLARSRSWSLKSSVTAAATAGVTTEDGGGGALHKRKHPQHIRSSSDGPPPPPPSSSHPPLVHHSNSAPEIPTTSSRCMTGLATVDEHDHNPDYTMQENIVPGCQLQRDQLVDVPVPPSLREGTFMTKVTSKKRKKVLVRLDPDMGQINWEVGQPLVRRRIIPIENIKEMRSGPDARYYREQFQLSQVHEDTWLTVIYIMDGNYKTLHLIAPSVEVFRMWDTTLRKLYDIRQQLMSGLGNLEMRQAMWEKQYWKGSDLEDNQRLRFDEVEKLCKRMNIHSSTDSLLRLFKQADVQKRGFLDFDDFRRFVKLLKGRPEVDRLYRKIRSKNGNVFDFSTFESFMREKQKSRLTQAELQEIFDRYATAVEQQPPSASSVTNGRASSPLPSSPTPPFGSLRSPVVSPPSVMIPVMTLEAFTSFLMSPDNSAFLDQHGKVWHDMTRPLPDYFVSSSHNTYLVGHQLVGNSTIEGYIRALLHSCRSVELDIYDGDVEPMIFHGKTFTSKVSLREVCNAIKKYGFVASPYPIIISAEVHCSVAQQDMIAEIMKEVFGDALVRMPATGKPKMTVLPSPEELKGRILLKTKDLTITTRQDSTDSDVFTETSGTSSASDSEVLQEYIRRDPESARMQSDGALACPTSPTGIVPPMSTSPSKRPPMQAAARTVIQSIRQVGKSAPSKAITIPLSPSVSGGNAGAATSILRGAPLVQSPRSEIPEAGSPIPFGVSRQPAKSQAKPKMSAALLALLVYTVGVKFQGINKKVEYAPEHMFSLSETTANKMIKAGDGAGMQDLIKHCRSHLVRVYPKGLRVTSTNYEPHRYWSAGVQLVAMNWQTFDLGYMMNHAMFQRNGRSGYVLKPTALRSGTAYKELLAKPKQHDLKLTIISAQQLPRPKDSSGRELMDRPVLDPYVEVTVHVPDWTYSSSSSSSSSNTPGGSGSVSERDGGGVGASASATSLPMGSSAGDGDDGKPGSTTTLGALSARSITYRTSAVKNNGFNPVWEEKVRIPFECVGDMWDLVFLRFVVRQEVREDEDPLAVYCVSLGSLGQGYRHLPLHDAQLSQYLFSTLFVRIDVDNVADS